MKKLLVPLSLTVIVGALAMAARYLLIQPAEIAHACDASSATWLCSLRMAVILSYARYELGYLALVASLAAIVWRNRVTSTSALVIGCAAIVLYCYEPGAVAMVVGALVLARSAQARAAQPTAT